MSPSSITAGNARGERPVTSLMRRLVARGPRRLRGSLRNPGRVLATAAAVRKFRRPLQLLRCYLKRTCPPELFVETRSGQRIYLSGDADDITTLLVVMGRKDYGPIPQGGVVVDVGGHLGSFTLYALLQGARQVYSYEPDPKLFEVLRRNVAEGGFAAKVRAYQAAVVGPSQAGQVYHPEGNAAGRMGPATPDDGGMTVATTALERVLQDNGIETVDLLKLDCEGSEYPIVFDTPDAIWRRIRRVRMEYHLGRVDELCARLEKLGYTLIHSQPSTVQGAGLLWFDRV